MIVLSEETIKGGELINEKRMIAGLQPLNILPVPLLEENKLTVDICEEEEQKISSSNYRMRLLGSLIRPPKVKSFFFSFNCLSIEYFCLFSQILIYRNLHMLLD